MMHLIICSGSADGEIFFKIVVVEPIVALYAYHAGKLGHMEYRLELNVPLGRLNDQYQPGKDRVTMKPSNGMLTGVPPGTHVLGIENKGNASMVTAGKAFGGLSHLITW